MNHRPGDTPDIADLTDDLREEIIDLRSGMAALVPTSGERYLQAVNAEAGNRMDFIDTHTGDVLTVGLCDAHGVAKALAWTQRCDGKGTA